MEYVRAIVDWAQWVIVIIGIPSCVLAGAAGLYLQTKHGRLWMHSYTTGAGIGVIDLIKMSLRKVDPEQIVNARVDGIIAGLRDAFSVEDLIEHYKAGGRVRNAVRYLVNADLAGKELSWKEAAARDLAGRKAPP